jgi:hypothetical protein
LWLRATQVQKLGNLISFGRSIDHHLQSAPVYPPTAINLVLPANTVSGGIKRVGDLKNCARPGHGFYGEDWRRSAHTSLLTHVHSTDTYINIIMLLE